MRRNTRESACVATVMLRLATAALFLAASVVSSPARAAPAAGQVDTGLANRYFEEAAALCEKDAGRLWGTSLCGPIVMADAATKTRVGNRPMPDAPPPPALGFANTALTWGDTRWTTIVWQLVPRDDAQARGRMMVHELFHRVQPALGLMGPDGDTSHLDTLDGRYWLRLEWRALAAALGASGTAERAAIADALAFRRARRNAAPDLAEQERRFEINEGLAQYTGTLLAAPDRRAAEADARRQLARAENEPSFVRTFPYPSGAAYGLLLDRHGERWRTRVKADSDLGELLMEASGEGPGGDVVAAAARYDGPNLRAAEVRRDAEHQARVGELRRQFVDGPVVVLPRANNASSLSAGRVAIPGAGMVVTGYRVTAEWGTLVASSVLLSSTRSEVVLPAPKDPSSNPVAGDGWTLTLAPGWSLVAAGRPGDYALARK